jgi:signal transduction histidine kinase/ligand-binding sensor domain-containing protein
MIRCKFRNQLFFAIFSISCLITQQCANAQQLALKSYTRANGLASDYVLCIFQDRSGRMWFGTDRGVSLYDGNSWKTFSTKDGLRHNLVYCIFQDRDGAMWFGTYDGGVTKYDGVHLRTWSVEDSLHDNTTSSIAQDPFGRMWFRTRYGICYFRHDSTFAILPSSAEHTIGPFPDGSSLGLSGGNVIRRIPTERDSVAEIVIPASDQVHKWLKSYRWSGTLYSEPNGSTIVFDDNILVRLRNENGLLKMDTLIADVRITSCAIDGKGTLWASSEENGLGKLTGESLQWYGERQGLARNRVLSILQDYEGTFWFGTFGGGVQRLLSEDLTIFRVEDGLLTNDITRVFEDSRYRIWSGSSKGVNLISDNRVVPITTFKSEIPDVRAFAEDASGNLYIGNFHGLLGPFQTPLGPAVKYRQPPRIDYGISSLLFQSIRNRSTNGLNEELWVGTYGAGLHRITRDSMRTYTMKNGLPSDIIEGIANGNSSVWLLSRDKGAARLQNDKVDMFTTVQELPSNSINTIYEPIHDGQAGEIWFGTDKGAAHFIAGKMELIDESRGLRGSNVIGIYPDSNTRNGIWIVTDRSLQKWRDGVLEQIGPFDLTPLEGISINGICFSPSTETFWLATSGGVVKVHPTGPRKQLPAPKVRIKNMAIDTISFSGDVTTSIILDAGQNNPAFEFAGLSFVDEKEVRYRYKLAGLDENWSQPTHSPRIQYRNLPDGKYKFLVVAVNEEGTLSIAPAEIAFTILPPFWKRWWFYSVATIGIASIFGGAVRYVSVRKMRLKVERLEREKAIEQQRQEVRERIARDLHDDVSSTLSSMSLFAEASKMRMQSGAQSAEGILSRLHDMSREAEEAMEQAVWSLSPNRQNLSHLVSRIHDVAIEQCREHDVTCVVHVEEIRNDFVLSDIVRKNCYLIFREILANVIRHSRAHNVGLSIKFSGDNFEMTFNDDGIGFSPDLPFSKPRGGNGLRNMHARAKEIGASLQIVSQTDKGSIITLLVQIAHMRY